MPLETHQCSDQELGLAQDDDGTAKMFPIVEQSRAEVQRYKKKFKCAPAEDLEIWGDFNSVRSQVIEVNFVKCDGHVECKSESEIRDWMREKYILLVYN